MRSLIWILLFLTFTLSADNKTIFNEACKEYDQQNYTESINKFQSLIQNGYENGEVYYNLGNCYYKSNDIVNALVYYEKAAKLVGNDEDLKANLAISRQKIIDKTEVQPVLPIMEYFTGLQSSFNIYSIKPLIIVSFLALSLSLSLIIWFRGFKTKILLITTASISGFFLLLSAGFAYSIQQNNQLEFGIITVEKSAVTSSPDENSNNTELFSLHKGAKVQVHRKIDGWLEISFSKDKKGWIDAGSLIII